MVNVGELGLRFKIEPIDFYNQVKNIRDMVKDLNEELRKAKTEGKGLFEKTGVVYRGPVQAFTETRRSKERDELLAEEYAKTFLGEKMSRDVASVSKLPSADPTLQAIEHARKYLVGEFTTTYAGKKFGELPRQESLMAKELFKIGGMSQKEAMIRHMEKAFIGEEPTWKTTTMELSGILGKGEAEKSVKQFQFIGYGKRPKKWDVATVDEENKRIMFTPLKKIRSAGEMSEFLGVVGKRKKEFEYGLGTKAGKSKFISEMGRFGVKVTPKEIGEWEKAYQLGTAHTGAETTAEEIRNWYKTHGEETVPLKHVGRGTAIYAHVMSELIMRDPNSGNHELLADMKKSMDELMKKIGENKPEF